MACHASETAFDTPVDPLNSAISLRVVGYAIEKLNTFEFKQGLLEIT